MAFWKKKSDDPWDRVPEKRRGTEESLAQEPTAEELRIRSIIEGSKESAVTPEVCPWCGKDMVSVSIYSRRGIVCWRKGCPGRWNDDDHVLQDPCESIWDIPSKSAWYCEVCEKIVVEAKVPRGATFHDPNTFADYARQWKEMEEREREAVRRKSKED